MVRFDIVRISIHGGMLFSIATTFYLVEIIDFKINAKFKLKFKYVPIKTYTDT